MPSTDIKSTIGKQDLNKWGGNATRTFTRRTSDGSLLTLHKIGNDVDVISVYGDGSTPTHTDLTDAITGVEGAECCFELAPGTWPVTADLTIPSNVTLWLRRGAAFSVSASMTLTINGPVFAEDTAWYSGAGTVSVAAAVSQVTGAAIKAGTTLECGTTLAVGTNATVGGTLGVTGVATLSGAATVGGTLGVTGATTVDDLTANGTLGGNLAFRGALAYAGSNQSIADDTDTVMAFDSEDYDTSAIHDNSTNNSRLTVPAGVSKVRLLAHVNFNISATGYRSLAILKNGAAFNRSATINMPGLASPAVTILSTASPVYEVVPGDYFEVRVRQTSGAPLNALGLFSYFALEIIE